MSGAVDPVKPVPTGLREAGLTIPLPVERLVPLLIRRAAYVERRSSSSREAFGSNLPRGV
jgi:hypothetical protein